MLLLLITISTVRCQLQLSLSSASMKSKPAAEKGDGAKPTPEGGAPGDETTRGEALKLVACGDFSTGRFFPQWVHKKYTQFNVQ